MSRTDEAQRLSLVLDRIQQIRLRVLEVRRCGPVFPMIQMFRNMEVQSRIQKELDRIVIAEEIEQWVAEEAKQNA